MGYRLELSAVRYLDLLGTKLYGYVSDDTLHQMKSYQFLEKHGFVDGDEIWDYNFEGNFVLAPDEAREFLTLYKDDVNTYSEFYKDKKDFDWDGKWLEIEELLNNGYCILLQWF